MSRGLADVATADLERLHDALASGRLRMPLTRTDLVRIGLRAQLDVVLDVLHGLDHTAARAIVDTALAERRIHGRPAPELVWTGPEGPRATARDTAVVLRELFESARSHVVLAGYSFLNAESVLAPLYRSMTVRGVKACFFVAIVQAEVHPPDPDAHGREKLAGFLTESWPFGPPYPTLYCDRRALRPGPPWCSLHAKCVSVDGERALISSANFTSRGQERNIEAGVLLRDRRFAEQLERQWMSFATSGLALCHQQGSDEIGS